MAKTDYVEGELIRISVEFRDVSGVLSDPDTIKLEVKTPADVVTSYEYGVDMGMSKSGVGQYYFDQAANEIGRWKAYWFTEGNFIAAGDTVFHVREKKTA